MYSLLTYSGDEIPASLFKQFCRARYKYIKTTDWNVPLDEYNQLEEDKYDLLPTTQYILVTRDTDDRLVCGTRVFSTLHPYQLEEDSYADITAGISLPKSRLVAESNRFVGAFSLDPAKAESTMMLMSGLSDYCEEKGFVYIIGVVEAGINEMLEEIGVQILTRVGMRSPLEVESQYMIIVLDIAKLFGDDMSSAIGRATDVNSEKSDR